MATTLDSLNTILTGYQTQLDNLNKSIGGWKSDSQYLYNISILTQLGDARPDSKGNKPWIDSNGIKWYGSDSNSEYNAGVKYVNDVNSHIKADTDQINDLVKNKIPAVTKAISDFESNDPSAKAQAQAVIAQSQAQAQATTTQAQAKATNTKILSIAAALIGITLVVIFFIHEKK